MQKQKTARSLLSEIRFSRKKDPEMFSVVRNSDADLISFQKFKKINDCVERKQYFTKDTKRV